MAAAIYKALITMTGVRRLNFLESKRAVNDLRWTGLRRPSLLAGKPEIGRSMMARDNLWSQLRRANHFRGTMPRIRWQAGRSYMLYRISRIRKHDERLRRNSVPQPAVSVEPTVFQHHRRFSPTSLKPILTRKIGRSLS